MQGRQGRLAQPHRRARGCVLRIKTRHVVLYLPPSSPHAAQVRAEQDVNQALEGQIRELQEQLADAKVTIGDRDATIAELRGEWR